MSSRWQSSRAECMLSRGMPTSTVGMPSRVAVMGPMVVPQGVLLLLTKCWDSGQCLSQWAWVSAVEA